MLDLLVSDIPYLHFIYELYYKDKFPFPDFSKFQFAHKVMDGDQIISAGGIKLIPELICITNKALSPRLRREALLVLLDVSKEYCRTQGFDQITSFIQEDPKWINQIKRYGFNDINGVGLVSGVD